MGRALTSVLARNLPRRCDRATLTASSEKECDTVNELVSNILKSYKELEFNILMNVWITLKLVMLSIILVKGDNTYPITHINKIKLEQEGNLRTEVLVNESILEIVDGF